MQWSDDVSADHRAIRITSWKRWSNVSASQNARNTSTPLKLLQLRVPSNARVLAVVLGLMERVLSARRALGSASRGRAGLYPVTEQHPVLIHPGDPRTPPARSGEPFLLLPRRLFAFVPSSSLGAQPLPSAPGPL